MRINRKYASSATTITKCEIYVLPSKRVLRLFRSDQRTADLMLQYEARKSRLLQAPELAAHGPADDG